MYGNDHNPPHIHVSFGEYTAIIGIKDELLIKGSLPRAKLKIANRFVQDNRKELTDEFYLKNPNLRNE